MYVCMCIYIYISIGTQYELSSTKEAQASAELRLVVYTFAKITGRFRGQWQLFIIIADVKICELVNFLVSVQRPQHMPRVSDKSS